MIRCSDGNFYVVKFQNNPQHRRVLANEMLATRLADAIDLAQDRPPDAPLLELVRVGT